jgi:anti-sigma B factor antagonist
MTSTLNIRVVEPATTVVEISGRLTLSDALTYAETSIKRHIADGSRKMAIDLAGLTSIDSAGIGMLISCGGEMEQAGGVLRVAGAHGAVAKTFEIVHMGRIVALDADVESACRNLSGNLSAQA